MIYTIGEMSKKMGVAPSTLRYYDKEGLMPFLERTGGMRIFRESDVEWLTVIGCLKRTGMPVKEIKKFVDWCMEGDATIGRRLELIDRQRITVEKQIEQLKSTLEILEYKHWYYETAVKAGSCSVHDDMPDSDIPERIKEIKAKLIETKE